MVDFVLDVRFFGVGVWISVFACVFMVVRCVLCVVCCCKFVIGSYFLVFGSRLFVMSLW